MLANLCSFRTNELHCLRELWGRNEPWGWEEEGGAETRERVLLRRGKQCIQYWCFCEILSECPPHPPSPMTEWIGSASKAQSLYSFYSFQANCFMELIWFVYFNTRTAQLLYKPHAKTIKQTLVNRGLPEIVDPMKEYIEEINIVFSIIVLTS